MRQLLLTIAAIFIPFGTSSAADPWLTPADSLSRSALVQPAGLWDSTDSDPWTSPIAGLAPALATGRADDPANPIQLVQASSGGAGGGGGDLASKSQNPISDLVSLPMQNNWDFGIEPGERTRYIGNLQPVVPVKLNEDWNLINRVIVPFVNVPVGADFRSHGIGDSLGQFFFSPRNSETFIWGIGPAVLFPTASNALLGFQEWGAGVNGVALISKGPVVAGALVYQVWSTEGTTKPFLVQPFFNYNLPEGWFVNVSGEANADWELPADSRWSFPLGAGVGRVFPIFGQPLNVVARFAPYLEKPPGGPDWQFRFAVTLLFPK